MVKKHLRGWKTKLARIPLTLKITVQEDRERRLPRLGTLSPVTRSEETDKGLAGKALLILAQLDSSTRGHSSGGMAPANLGKPQRRDKAPTEGYPEVLTHQQRQEEGFSKGR